MDKDTMIEELAKELGICLDDEGSGRFATRYPHGQVAFEGDQLMYVLLLKRDLAYWREARKPRWIPCTERMPEEEAHVLIFVNNWEAPLQCVAYTKSDGDSLEWNVVGCCGYEWEEDFQQKDVTHWMPLPEGPE